MENKDVHLVAILDRSGSMASLTEEMRSGFNSLKAQQLKEEGETYITLTTFDTVYERLYTGVNVKNVPDLTSSEYYARGGTALLDAVGRTITEVSKLKNLPKKVLVVIATDGQENSSVEWRDKAKIKELIESYEKRSKNPWSFIFMGAGVDAFDSTVYGFVGSNRTINVTASAAGTQAFYGAVGQTINSLRSHSGEFVSTMDISGMSNVNYGNNPITLDPLLDPKISKSQARRVKIQLDAQKKVSTP